MNVGDRQSIGSSIVQTDPFGTKESVGGGLCVAYRSADTRKSLETPSSKRSVGGG